MTKVSIIMGVYNCGEDLAAAIESILQQSYTNWELIMCDDGSTDNSYAVAEKYRSKNPDRIKLLKNAKNIKLAGTLNRCLAEATGLYVARMDADDIMLPDRLKKQAEFLDQNSQYAVVGGLMEVFDGQKVVAIRGHKEHPTRSDLLKNPVFFHPTIMMRKEVYDKLGGYTVAKRTQRGQDWDLWFRFFAAGYEGYNLQEPMIIYHESPDDYKKRSLKTGLGYCMTALHGYRLLKVPVYKYVYALKPLVSVITPPSIRRVRRLLVKKDRMV